MAENKVSYGGFNLIYIRCRSPPSLRSFHLERRLCPIFGGGNFTPKTSNYCHKKIGHQRLSRHRLFSYFPNKKKSEISSVTPAMRLERKTIRLAARELWAIAPRCVEPPSRKKSPARSQVADQWVNFTLI